MIRESTASFTPPWNRVARIAEGPRSLPPPLTRGDDLADHVAEDVGQPEIAAGMTEGEAFVIEAQELQHGRMQVVN